MGGGTHNGTDPLDKPWLKDIVEESSEMYKLMHVGEPNQLWLIVEDLKELKRLREKTVIPSGKEEA
ncbi:hypothetical protein DRO27_02790 [Candidatus Bathyarchaeota archaeon]|nr:MAG: hypothetical protein DRO27_02790 [Candidatus Bathyarchaeota archaeon]